MLLRIVTSIVVFVATNYFVYWITGGLLHQFFDSQGGGAFPFSLLLAISLCAAVVASLYVWKRLGGKQKESNPTSHSVTPEYEVNVTSCVLLGAILSGSIGFIGGFFGPLILMPDVNLGPLLGIFVTGPAGILLGPPLGIAIKMRHIGAKQLRAVTLWLTFSMLFACCFYAFSTSRFIVGAQIAVFDMVFIFLVGCSLLSRSASLYQHKWVVGVQGIILLAGVSAVVFISAMPPVMRPWWEPKESHSLQPIPSHAFIWDSDLTASHLIAVDIDRWQQYILTIVLSVMVTSLVVVLADRIFSKRK